MNRTKSLRAHVGFTLIEILIVVGIIALIGTYAASKVFEGGDNAKAKITKSKISGLVGTLDLFKLDVGRYPSTQEGLKALVEAPSGVSKWNGPYLRNADQIKDEWDNDFVYRSPGELNRQFEIISLGADRKEGGDSPSTRDIKSWE